MLFRSPTPSDGWANSFVSPATGNAKIAYENSGRRRLVSVGQILLWLGAVASLSARRGWREALPWGKAKRRRSNLVTPDELLQTDGSLERAVDLVSQRTPAGDADAQLGTDPQLGSEAK